MANEYKAVVYREGMLGSLFLGASRINPVRLTDFLNSNAEDGWRVVTMEKDVQRMLFFFRREAYVILLEREKGELMQIVERAEETHLEAKTRPTSVPTANKPDSGDF